MEWVRNKIIAFIDSLGDQMSEFQLVDSLYTHIIDKYRFSQPDNLDKNEEKNVNRGGSMVPILRDIRKTHSKIKQTMVKIESLIMLNASDLHQEENKLLIKFEEEVENVQR